MPTLKSIVFVLVIFLSGVLKVVAQKTSGSLAVDSEDGLTLNQITQQLARTKSDTNAVNLMISQSHLYWLEETNQNNFLDSSRIIAETALNLSNRLHYIKGSNEANFMICRIFVENDDIKSALALTSKVYGEERARLLLIISEHFVFSKESPSPIDKAYPIILNAINTSRSAGSSSWYYQSLLLLGKYYFLKSDIKKGKDVIFKIIKSCEIASDFAGEAHYWSELGIYLPKSANNDHDIINSHAMAVKYYLIAGNKREAAYSLRDKAYAERNADQLDVAEKDALKSISILDSLKVPLSYNTCAIMADIYQQKCDFIKALKYALAGLSIPDHSWGAYATLGNLYDELGQPKKASEYQKLSFDYAVSINHHDMYYFEYRLIEDQIKIGETKSALAQLMAFTKKFKPVMPSDKELVAATYGDLYYDRHDYRKAKNYYLEMIKQDKAAAFEKVKTLGNYNTIVGREAFYKIGGFYLEQKQYALARSYLLKALPLPNSSNIGDKSNVEILLFKADSALGKFLSAIRYFESSKNTKDSLFSTNKSRQIAELEIKYQTEQREKSFLALKNKSILQKTELERQNSEKKITFACVGVLLIISGLVYNGYRNKKKINVVLEIKQEEINLQNSALQKLLNEKDGLLTEKDWLLKEVHHRVKNNLQIVMSLLSSQSAYLENTAALDAIRESQNRVQAISLIHQKLYSSTNVANIKMPAYVSDLVGYLADCFDTNRRGIKIEQLVESFNLDLAQAVPLGLILNEAITNAIKYAFDKKGGEIIIAIQLVGSDGLMLNISDNGKGLPPDFDIKKTNSLGMEMMKALSKQLGGEFKVRNKSGLHISIEFTIEREFTQKPKLNME